MTKLKCNIDGCTYEASHHRAGYAAAMLGQAHYCQPPQKQLSQVSRKMSVNRGISLTNKRKTMKDIRFKNQRVDAFFQKVKPVHIAVLWIIAAVLILAAMGVHRVH